MTTYSYYYDISHIFLALKLTLGANSIKYIYLYFIVIKYNLNAAQRSIIKYIQLEDLGAMRPSF